MGLSRREGTGLNGTEGVGLNRRGGKNRGVENRAFR